MATLTAVLAVVAEAVTAAADELNRLDGVAGDGDLGVTMTTAATVVAALLPELEGQDAAAVLKRLGSEVARKAPSTSGTLLATGLLRAGRAISEDASGGPVAQAARLVAAAQAGIQQRGGVAPGDKTAVDAIDPAARALLAAADEGVDLATAFARAATAAAEGAAATATMRATVGRAGWLAERSEGHVDAGARLVAIIFAAAARRVQPA
ncbi:MAG: DAK2 domain-containing protein [Chloroflexi bacterium]|nr:DAK2 domain-containing protein [Chloroflexota bacterium]